MPADQFPSIPQFEISTITEQELQRPGVSKVIAKRCLELEAECRSHDVRLEVERRERERILIALHEADSQRQVLEARLEVLNNRDAISQLLWGAMAIVVAMMIDFGRSKHWAEFAFCVAAAAFMCGAVLLLQGYSKKAK